MTLDKFTKNNLTFEIHQATAENREQINQLMHETATWLKNAGSTQWNDILEGTDVHQIGERIHQNEVFLLTQGKETAGTMIVRKTPSSWDNNLWGEKAKETAYYVHRLMIRRTYKGMELANKMLQFAEKQAALKGVPYLRLDTLATNVALNRLYSQTFTFLLSKDGYALYEKQVEPLK